MPIPEDFYEATLIYKPGTSPRVCTCAIGLQWTGGGSAPDAGECADIVYTAAVEVGSVADDAWMITGWLFMGVSVALGTSTGDQVGQHLDSVNGDLTDNTPPSNCAVLISKNTALGGRKYRGRLFFPPVHLNEGAVNQSGELTSGVVSSNQSNWDGFLGNLSVANLEPVLFHQGSSPPVPTPITSVTVQSLLATQRRRMRG